MGYKLRPCSFCAEAFQPVSSGNKHCSVSCRFLDIMAAFNGTDGCWVWPRGYFKVTGYGQFAIDTRTPITAHRMAYQTLIGEVASGLYVCHRCDNRACFNPAHLFAGTPSANNRDMWNKGRQQDYSHQPRGSDHPLRRNPGLAARGKQHGMVKYSEETIIAILQATAPAKDVALTLGVPRWLVYAVRAKTSWAWLGTSFSSRSKDDTIKSMAKG